VWKSVEEAEVGVEGGVGTHLFFPAFYINSKSTTVPFALGCGVMAGFHLDIGARIYYYRSRGRRAAVICHYCARVSIQYIVLTIVEWHESTYIILCRST
jgi:hypothetical protein